MARHKFSKTGKLTKLILGYVSQTTYIPDLDKQKPNEKSEMNERYRTKARLQQLLAFRANEQQPIWPQRSTGNK